MPSAACTPEAPESRVKTPLAAKIHISRIHGHTLSAKPALEAVEGRNSCGLKQSGKMEVWTGLRDIGSVRVENTVPHTPRWG